MEEDLRARLLEDAGLTALVSDRIAWLDRPQGDALPALILQLITSGRSYTFKGATRLAGDRVQFDCWGRSYLEARALACSVIAAVEPEATQGGTRFSRSFLGSDRSFEPETLPGGIKVFRVSMDFIVWHSPAA